MQRTEKYFENDAFRKTAAGVILAAEADAKTGGGRIALDGTVFYSEGGRSARRQRHADPRRRHGA